MTDSTERRSESKDADDTHLEDIEDGAGCTEIWEHLAEKRGT